MTAPPRDLTAALADRYRVERELGAGGMATVYLAHDLKHDRPVALKVLRPELAAVLGPERFLAEIKTTARLQHPHILPLLDSGSADGQLYYVMPYVTGETLRQRLTQETQLGVEETLRITRVLAAALDYAHGEGVVHRDLKPENILFQADEPVLADFGIALAVKAAGGARLTETGLSLGTPQYMSPEQAAGDRTVDARSDVYALGCLVYEMLAGEPPHTGPTVAAVIMKVMTQVPVPLTVVRPGLPGGMEAAVLKALAKAPTDRFPSAGGFAAALTSPLPTAAPEKSIVVLPFDNLSPDPNDAYLAEGLTEEVISDLSRVRALKVISRNSAVAVRQRTQDVKEIARLVDVRYVLEGSVRRAGNSLRITAQLIDGATDAHAWAEKYSGTMDDVFAMQERVSRAIVDALQVALTPAESRRLAERPVSNEVAYECLVRARDELYRGTLDALTRGIALLDRGLEVGGENAWLLGTKAELLFRRHDLRPTGDYRSVREGQAIALRALELEPRCAVAEVSLGMLKVFEPPGAVSALPHLRRAVELEPNNVDALIWLAIVEYMLERIDQSAAAAARVATLDPIFLQFSAWPAGIAALGGRFVEADRLFAPFVAAAHVAPTLGPLYANWLLAPMRRVEELGAHALHQARMFPGEPFFEVAVFQYHALRGDVEAAAAAMTPELHDLIWHGAGCWTYWAARGYAVLGDADRALALLERATSLGFLAHDALAYHDPLFESLRPDPRLQALLARIKAEREKLPAI